MFKVVPLFPFLQMRNLRCKDTKIPAVTRLPYWTYSNLRTAILPHCMFITLSGPNTMANTQCVCVCLLGAGRGAGFSHSVVSDSLQPMYYSLPHSSAHGTFQARILEWVAISYSRVSCRPRDWTHVSCLASGFFTTTPPQKPSTQWVLSKYWLNEQLHEVCFQSTDIYTYKQHSGFLAKIYFNS